MKRVYFVEIKRHCFSHEDAKMVEGEIVDSWPDDWIPYFLNVWTKHRASVRCNTLYDLTSRSTGIGSKVVARLEINSWTAGGISTTNLRCSWPGCRDDRDLSSSGSVYFRNWKKCYVAPRWEPTDRGYYAITSRDGIKCQHVR